MRKRVEEIIDAINREPWANAPQIARRLGVSKFVIYSNLNQAGVTFTEVKNRRTKELSIMAGFPPIAEHEAKQEKLS